MRLQGKGKTTWEDCVKRDLTVRQAEEGGKWMKKAKNLLPSPLYIGNFE